MNPRLARVSADTTLVVAAVAIVFGAGPFVLDGELGLMFADWVPVNAATAALAVLASLLARRQPGSRLLWVLIAISACGSLHLVGNGLTHLGLPTPRPPASSTSPAGVPLGASMGLWLTNAAYIPAVGLLMTSFLLRFPDGTLPSRRSRLIERTGWLGILVATTGSSIAYGPWVTTTYADLNATVLLRPDVLTGMVVVAAAASASVISLVVRARRADGIRQQQYRWFTFGAVVFAATMVISLALDPGSSGDGFQATNLTLYLSLPALLVLEGCIAVAVLRYRLHDIDIVISRTLVFAALATVITAVYVAFVVGLGTLIGDTDNLLLSVIATAAVAVAFEPMRQRVQHAANVLVFGERAYPYEVLAGMTGEGNRGDLHDVVVHAATLLGEAAGATRVVVWRRDDGHLTPTWSWPDVPDGEPVPMPTDHAALEGWDVTRLLRTDQGVVGAVTLDKLRGEPIRTSDVQLVDEFAGQAAVLVAHARLQANLQDSAHDLTASRRRLLTAQSDARQRLERDIHDGAQQNLVALRVKIGLAKRLADNEGATAVATLLDDLAGDAVDAIDSLRSLARGVYPPLLEAEGLTAAITAQVRQASVPVTVMSDDLDRHDRDIESTVYFCVLEALANAVKYAHADHIEVELRQAPEHVHFRVTDDGQGFDPDTATTGTGLVGLSDRLDAVDGTLVVRSQPGQGTTIEGSVPRQDASSDVAVAQRDTSTSGPNSALGTKPMAPASTAPRS